MTSTLNTLKSNTGSRKKKLRKGRGIAAGQGASCGFGMRGQKSRSGRPTRPGFEGGQMPLQMRLPKYGFTSRVGLVTSEVRTSELNKVKGDIVSLETLRESGVITAGTKRAKIMLSGQVDKKLTVKGLRVSKGARELIESAGGAVLEAEDKVDKLEKKAAAAPEEEKD